MIIIYKYGDEVTLYGLYNEFDDMTGNIIEFDEKLNMYKIRLNGVNKLDRIIVAVNEKYLK